jgi:hypothetical protein
MPLLNVRLNAEEQRLADDLRKEGVRISRLVREAIRAEHARRVRPPRRQRPSQIVAELLQRFPDIPGERGHGIDTTDRRAVQRYISSQLRRRK